MCTVQREAGQDASNVGLLQVVCQVVCQVVFTSDMVARDVFMYFSLQADKSSGPTSYS